MQKLLTVIFVTLVLSAGAPSAARGPYGSVHIGNWNGGAFTLDTNGQFSGCSAEAIYKSGISVVVRISADNVWQLAFAHPEWKLQIGQPFPIVLTLDGQAPINVGGVPITQSLVAVQMPSNSSLIAQFRKAKSMSAFAQGQLFQFDFTGTSQLMLTLANCVKIVKEKGIAEAGDFTVKLPEKTKAPDVKPPAVTAPAAAVASLPLPTAVTSNLTHRVALVIGNGDYRSTTKLLNPPNDAADMASALRKIGFDVVEGKDLDHRGMDNAIREFGRKLDNADLAVFFYAGHGLQVGGKNYLVPIDAKLERPGDLALDAMDVSLVLAQMESDKRVNLIFLDACRDNPLARTLARAFAARSTSVGQGLASIQSAVGTMIAYSTQPDNVALDGDGRNSPFTSALLKHISDANVDISVVMRRVRADVIAATREKQVPWDHSSLVGDVVLAR
jgi:hypothetical protein